MTVLTVMPADKGGCGFYRLLQPAHKFSKLTGTALGVTEAGKSLPMAGQWIEGMKRHGFDTVLIQRTFEDHQANYWRSVKSVFPELKIFMDFDDLLWNPCTMSTYKPTPKMLANLDAVAGIADRLIASTKPMADALWHRYKKRAKILPNMLADNAFRRVIKRSPREKMRVFWGGSNTHMRDILMVEEAVKKTAGKYEWHFMGFVPESLRGSVRYYEGADMGRYLDVVAGIKPHVGIAPLVASPFNKCKSNIKLLEYGAIGMATIASGVYPYNNSAARLSNAGTTSEWLAALEYMEDENQRIANAERSLEYSKTFSIESRTQDILNAYN